MSFLLCSTPVCRRSTEHAQGISLELHLSCQRECIRLCCDPSQKKRKKASLRPWLEAAAVLWLCATWLRVRALGHYTVWSWFSGIKPLLCQVTPTVGVKLFISFSKKKKKKKSGPSPENTTELKSAVQRNLEFAQICSVDWRLRVGLFSPFSRSFRSPFFFSPFTSPVTQELYKHPKRYCSVTHTCMHRSLFLKCDFKTTQCKSPEETPICHFAETASQRSDL